MRRCPKCGRTFDNDRQKFCTLDGTGLLDVEVLNEAESQRVEQGETIRIDSAQLNSAELNDEMTKIISREPPRQSIPSFDPYKTVVADAGETSSAPPPPATASPPPEPPAPASAPPSETPPASQPAPIEAPAEPPAPATPSASPPPAASPDLLRTTAAVSQQPLSSSSLTPAPAIQASAAEPPASQPQPQPQPPAPPMHTAAARPKRSKVPLILGILAVLFMFFLVAAGAGYWFLLRPYLAKRAVIIEPERPAEPPAPESTPGAVNPTPKAVAEVPPYNPPADAVQFVNSKDNLDGKLAEHYVDFSFYYPEGWRKDPKAGVPGASNFAKVERRLPPDFTQENFAVGWYSSAGSAEGDTATFPTLAKNLSDQLANSFTEYQKVSEGPTKVGAYPGYEFRFESTSRNTAKGDIEIWGRVIFLPPADGGSNGVTLLMLATSLAPELNSVKDVGVKGQLPMMLESFRFGK
jgi:hypothetical protein